MSSPEPRAVAAPAGSTAVRAAAEQASVADGARADAIEAARTLTPATRRDFALVVPALDEAPMVAALVAELKRA